MSSELAIDREPHPLAMIQESLARGLTPDQLNKLFDLAERHEKAEAARVFAAAITAFQAECPPIIKGRSVKNTNGTPRYKFANYEDLMAVAGPILARHGIAITFDTLPCDGMLSVQCKVRVGVHVEPSAIVIPLLAGGNGSNDVQALGSTISYGKRYALVNALNIVVMDEDDDARSARPAPQQQRPQSPPPPPPPSQKFAAEDNKRARAAAVAAYAACPDVDAFRTISQQVKADAERGIFSQADLDAIRDVARQTSDLIRLAALPPQTTPQPVQDIASVAIRPERVSVADLQQMIHKKKLPADVVELEAVLRLVQAAVGQEQSVDLDELISQEVEGSDGVPVEMWTKKQVKAGWSAIQNWVRGLPPAGKLIGEPAATNLPG